MVSKIIINVVENSNEILYKEIFLS